MKVADTGKIEKSFEHRMINLYKDLITKIEQVQEAKVTANFTIHGFRMFEIFMRISEKDSFIATVNIQLETLQQMGITARLSGFKKVQAWIDTPEGLNYVIKARKRLYEREINKYAKKIVGRGEAI